MSFFGRFEERERLCAYQNGCQGQQPELGIADGILDLLQVQSGTPHAGLVLANVMQESYLFVLGQPFGLDGGVGNKEKGQGAHDGGDKSQNDEHDAPSLQ